MDNSTRATLATGLAAGYVVGRTKNGKLALILASLALGRSLDPKALIGQGVSKLAKNPEFAHLSEQLRGQLLGNGRSVLSDVANRGVTSLAGAVQERTSSLLDVEPDEKPEAEESDEDTYEAEDEQDGQEDEEDQEMWDEDEEPEAEEEEEEEEEEEPARAARRRPAKRARAGKPTDRKPGPKNPPAKRAMDRKSADRRAGTKKASSKGSAARSARSSGRR